MILVIDDLRIFPDKINGQEVVHCVNSPDALRFLEANWLHITEIFLDHDLGYSAELGTYDTIVPVINWLDEKGYNEENKHIKCLRSITSNPVGEVKIKALAKRKYKFEPRIEHIDWRHEGDVD